MSYSHCPIEYRENCLNYLTQCHKCLAKDESLGEDYFYSPIIRQGFLGYKFHPYSVIRITRAKEIKKRDRINKKNSNKSKEGFKNNKQGRIIESKVLSKSGVKLTKGSGAVFKDGDGVVKNLRIEHKTRFNGRNTLGPRKDEWDKALSQGVDVFMVTDSNTNQTVVTMTQELFNRLIDNLKE